LLTSLTARLIDTSAWRNAPVTPFAVCGAWNRLLVLIGGVPKRLAMQLAIWTLWILPRRR